MIEKQIQIQIRGSFSPCGFRSAGSREWILFFSLLMMTGWFSAPGSAAGDPSENTPSRYRQDFLAGRANTVVELQQFRTVESIDIRDSRGREGRAELINLNPSINAWYLLTLQWNASGDTRAFHLENIAPRLQILHLDAKYPRGILIKTRDGGQAFDLWSDLKSSPLSSVTEKGVAYSPLCDGKVFLRNPVAGNKTTMEWTTDFLRNYVPGGETITNFIKQEIYKDAFLITSDIVSGSPGDGRSGHTRPPGAPAPPLIKSAFENKLLRPPDLGIELINSDAPRVYAGKWYESRVLPDVYVNTLVPGNLSEDVILKEWKHVNPLDEVEAKALVHLVAFDLDRYDLRYMVGTEHPKVNWSDRVQTAVRDDSIPGPDGFETVEPLVRTGMVNPVFADHVVAAFTGGFKRYHGAFKSGEWAAKNRGSHYGFIENGVVLSKLHTGLATIIITRDGRVDLKTWTDRDNENLDTIRYARQNGMPLVDFDPETGLSAPGKYVSKTGLGNWSGSVEGKYRTLRAGVAIQEFEGRRYLIYGYFSSATAAAMARVFQAAKVRYAMLTDINALEHTYLALYKKKQNQFEVQHLIREMSVLDKTIKNQVAPRFIGYADNRDFFYLLERNRP